MTSMLVLVITINIIVAINGEAADLQTDENVQGVASEIEGCPYLENAEYKVTVKGSVSTLIGGCATINYNSSDTKSQSYSLWFGNIYNGEGLCRDNGIEYFRFYCHSKSPSPSEDITKGRMYIQLYDDAVNSTEEPDRRCAAYEKVNENDYVMTFRLAVSSNISCDGLSDILKYPRMIRLHKKGSMLLEFSKARPDAPQTPAPMTTAESLKIMYNQYEKWGYILQNFGSRPNPLWKIKSRKIQDGGKRLLS